MEDNMVCSRSKRIISFSLDRLFVYSSLIIFVIYNPLYQSVFDTFLSSMIEGDFINSMLYTLYIVGLSFIYILLFYFINFVIIQYIFKTTVGRSATKTRLVVWRNNETKNPTFKDLLKRYFYLYLSGIGGIGYLYPFGKNNKSGYDDSIQMYVINKEKIVN